LIYRLRCWVCFYRFCYGQVLCAVKCAFEVNDKLCYGISKGLAVHYV